MADEGKSPLLTLPEVAERIRQSVKTVRRKIATRELKAAQLSSRAWRVEERELERYIESRSTTLRSTDVSQPLRFRAKVSNG